MLISAASVLSDRMSLETPIIALRLFEHFPKGALPLTRLFVLLLDPECYLHHAPGDVPIAPQGLHSLVIIAWPRSLVEERAPSILVLADQLNLLKRILRLPLLDFLPDLANRGLRRDRHREHAQRSEHLHLWHMILIALSDLSGAPC